MLDRLRWLVADPLGGRVNRVDDDPTGLLGSDPTGILDGDWFATREVATVDAAESGTASPSSRFPVESGVVSPSLRSPLTAESSRGTFVLPRSRPFLRALENRARNGAHEIMHPLDDPEYYDYERATVDPLETLIGAMAESVAAAYDD